VHKKREKPEGRWISVSRVRSIIGQLARPGTPTAFTLHLCLDRIESLEAQVEEQQEDLKALAGTADAVSDVFAEFDTSCPDAIGDALHWMDLALERPRVRALLSQRFAAPAEDRRRGDNE
jgi:hypothetical protein